MCYNVSHRLPLLNQPYVWLSLVLYVTVIYVVLKKVICVVLVIINVSFLLFTYEDALPDHVV